MPGFSPIPAWCGLPMPLIDDTGDATDDGLIAPPPLLPLGIGALWMAGTPDGILWTVGAIVRVFITAIRRRNSCACCNLSGNGRNRFKFTYISKYKSHQFLPLLQLLLLQFVFDVRTERHRTLGLLTMFCMVTTQCNQLLANRTTTVRFAFAQFCVAYNAFHLLTRRQTTICIATLARMHQRLNASLNRLFACLLWICLLQIARRRTVVQIETELFHFMWMANFIFAAGAQVKVLCINNNNKKMINSIHKIEINKLTSQTVQWYRVSTWFLQLLQV